MVFEIIERDLMGKIGRIKTKSGYIETPALLPVVNPLKLTIPPNELKANFKVPAIITNAYILRKNCGESVISRGVHEFLDFKGPIMTDSGAYQLLVYGAVDITSEEIIRFQELINADICVFLDTPTGSGVNYKTARQTVDETLRRARECIEIKSKEGVLWVGPIQGGEFIDLVEESSRRMGELPFDIYAIGSPTKFLEQYNYSKIVEMIAAAKRNLPLNKPVHLFGAGHPMVFPLAIALGCDIFDSASYALYAEGDRYITSHGTRRLSELRDVICTCPVCAKHTPDELLQMGKNLRTKLLAEHNLHAILNEVNNIKCAIREGRLWEYLELNSRSHPSLYEAFKLLKKYQAYLEKGTPTSKKRALLWLSDETVNRPEIKRHLERLINTRIPWQPEVLILVAEPKNKPFNKSKLFNQLLNTIIEKDVVLKNIQIAILSKMFGLIPLEIEEYYPLSQHLTPTTISETQLNLIKDNLIKCIEKNYFKKIILLNDENQYGEALINLLLYMKSENKISDFKVFTLNRSDRLAREDLLKLKTILTESVKEC
ncbi:MAG: tRNA guanosine(15) transglycosylase TgtA [Candidatus Odinarchaeum yellowstonii]|uniref:tRNA-guanine(15) transglycosylase n=1 Tax=Odinarchaeota yellowstonii (strain LCB_4) TaxID=1841599 RepID=A0AAF0D3I3_ODILC|nr:MAG: tRNA guanosine(15) transglycosylase TgtA [Candidatus Odinarchaeum yellowstonii]